MGGLSVQITGLADSTGLVSTSPAGLSTRLPQNSQASRPDSRTRYIFLKRKIIHFKNIASPRVRMQLFSPVPCDLSLGYRTCAHESGESGSPAPGQKSRSAKSTSPRVRWSIFIINVKEFIRFRPDLWPDSLTSPGVHKSGDPALAKLVAGHLVGVHIYIHM